MRVVFWVLCGLAAYAYVGYPVLLWALARLGARRFEIDEAYEPAVSVLIPAFNEERLIARKIDNTLDLDYPAGKLEILVASESDDATDRIVAGYRDRGVRLLSSSTRRGKVANLQRAVPSASGEILVFTDANAMLERDVLRKLVRHFADARVGSVSGRLVYVRAAAAASAPGEEAYWGFEMMVKRASSALGSLPGANGSLFALRRDLYRPISARRGDDFELPIRVILQGYASIMEAGAITREEASEGYLEQYRRKVRIINWMSGSALILLREALAAGCWLLALQLVSHKINRWTVPFWLLALLPVSLWLAPRGSVYLLAATAQMGIYTLALVGWTLAGLRVRAPRLVALAAYFVVVNAASLVGILTALAGREAEWHKRADRLC